MFVTLLAGLAGLVILFLPQIAPTMKAPGSKGSLLMVSRRAGGAVLAVGLPSLAELHLRQPQPGHAPLPGRASPRRSISAGLAGRPSRPRAASSSSATPTWGRAAAPPQPRHRRRLQPAASAPPQALHLRLLHPPQPRRRPHRPARRADSGDGRRATADIVRRRRGEPGLAFEQLLASDTSRSTGSACSSAVPGRRQHARRFATASPGSPSSMASTASASSRAQLGSILAGGDVADQRRQVRVGGLELRRRVLEGLLEIGDRQRQQHVGIGRDDCARRDRQPDHERDSRAAPAGSRSTARPGGCGRSRRPFHAAAPP